MESSLRSKRALVDMSSELTDSSDLASPNTAGQSRHDRTNSADDSVHTASHGHSQVVRIHLSDRAMSVIAIILAALAIGILIMMIPLIDAKVQAGGARAEATANTANQHARIALDKVEDFRAKLAEKGIPVTLDGH